MVLADKLPELLDFPKDLVSLEAASKTLKDFLVGAEAEVRTLTSPYSNVGRNADALALYFGEDPAQCPFEQVISTLLNFVKMFVRAHEENHKQLELEKKKAQKEAENEKMKLSAQRRKLQGRTLPAEGKVTARKSSCKQKVVHPLEEPAWEQRMHHLME